MEKNHITMTDKKENSTEVPLTKKEFVDIINRLKEANDLVNKVNDLFQNSRENLECDYCNGASLQISHESVVVNLLQKLMRDSEEWISYFIYELEYGTEEQWGMLKEEGINIKTPEALYEHLVSLYFIK